MTAEEERDWIIDYLWPTLKKNNFHHIKIFIMDENRIVLPFWPRKVFEKAKARNIVSGITVHMYFDFDTNPDLLDQIKRDYPEKLIFYTEGCVGPFGKFGWKFFNLTEYAFSFLFGLKICIHTCNASDTDSTTPRKVAQLWSINCHLKNICEGETRETKSLMFYRFTKFLLFVSRGGLIG